jgi:glucose/arabinose dehydrogenase
VAPGRLYRVVEGAGTMLTRNRDRESIFLGALVVVAAVALAVSISASTAARPAEAATTPPGFSDALVTSVSAPTGLAFTPDERLLVTTQPGQLRVVDQSGQLLPAPALDLASKLCSNNERGLLGVAVDPDFASNHYVYLYYTYKKHGVCPTGQPTNPNNPVNRVSRFVLPADNVIDPATEKVLVDNIPSPGSVHNAGDLHFGKDGYLYISVGDGGWDYAGDSGSGAENDASRDQHVLLGKILRVTRNGEIPPDNPYLGPDSAPCSPTNGRTDPGKKCQETFAWGLRNPFRMAFDPNATGTRFFINDVGQNEWEEVDEGRAGADYGWNVREGHCVTGSTTDCGPPPQGMTNPIHDYPHAGCSAITGGAFVPNGVWPVEYDGTYLYGDYSCGKIFKITPASGGGYSSLRTEFVTDLGGSSAVAMAFGPHAGSQSLYYTNYTNGGQVRRIDYTGDANRSPTAALTADPTSGSTPLTVNFDGSGSSDPDAGDTLTYLWDFGDGTTSQTTTPTTSHQYTTSGTYTAKLTVRDNSGAVSSPPATVRVDPGNNAPSPTIVAPAAGARFSVGQEITLTGEATDPEDGTLSGAKLNWEVIRHHRGTGPVHTHPYFTEVGNNIEFQAPSPEDLASTGDGNHLEIRLTATDSKGLKKTVTRILEPKRVQVTLGTDPAGLKLGVNGDTITAPQELTSWENHNLNVNAPLSQTLNGTPYEFVSWSDGGAASHTIVTPASAATYTAIYERSDDTTPPNTTITSGPSGTVTSSSASFGFSSDDLGATFECSLDGAAFTGCTSQQSYTNLSAGSHTFEVRAIDAASNVDPTPASSSWTVLATFQENDRDRIRYGNWHYQNDSGFAGRYASMSRAAGDKATLTFTGTNISWKTQKRPDGGITDVYLDGRKVKTFDGYSATTQYQIGAFSQTGLTSGTHTLELLVTGNKNPNSTGTYTVIDNFAVKKSDGTTNTILENNTDIDYVPWSGKKDGRSLGGNYRESSSVSLPMYFMDFTGPRVDLITAKGPNRGQAVVRVLDNHTGALVKTVTLDLGAPTEQWKVEQSISGLDPTKSYRLKVSSADGKPVVVDGFHAVPYTGPGDTTPPETTITNGPSGTVTSSSATLEFSSDDQDATFECSLDGAAFEGCTSPRGYSGLGDGSHTFEVRAIDSNGNVDPTAASSTWTVDATALTVQPPQETFSLGTTLGTSTVPVKLSWSATGSGVVKYELQQSTNGGAYAKVSLPSATATALTRQLTPGNAYQFRVRAQDQAGNWSDWAQGSEFVVNAHQETDGAISYSGSWTQQVVDSAFGGSLAYGGTVRDTALFTFVGRDVAWVAPKGTNRGRAEVWVDGVKVKTVDLYASSTQPRKVVFSKEWASAGSHTVEVRVLGTKNASSTGTRVDVDAFVVLR